MTQEEINSLRDNHPSHEAEGQCCERIREAKARGCRCADRAGGHDAECLWSNHSFPSTTRREREG